MNKKQMRNGEIDFLRFVFASVVLLSHFNDSFQFGWFSSGAFGVEFFFLLSGYYLAQSASKQIESNSITSIPNETWKFTGKKISSFYHYFIVGIIADIVIRLIAINGIGLVPLLKKISNLVPDLTLTMMALTPDAWFLSGSWYLSVMILVSFILYPLLLYKFEHFSKIILPVIGLFLLGGLYHTFGKIVFVHKWIGIFPTPVVRGLAEMAIGVSLYPLVKFINARTYTTFAKITATIMKLVCFGMVFVFVLGRYTPQSFDLYAFLFCAIGITLSLSNIGYHIPNSSFTSFLGKFSLPIYIFHGVVRLSAQSIFGKEIETLHLCIAILIAYVFSYVMMLLSDQIRIMVHKIKLVATK